MSGMVFISFSYQQVCFIQLLKICTCFSSLFPDWLVWVFIWYDFLKPYWSVSFRMTATKLTSATSGNAKLSLNRALSPTSLFVRRTFSHSWRYFLHFFVESDLKSGRGQQHSQGRPCDRPYNADFTNCSVNYHDHFSLTNTNKNEDKSFSEYCSIYDPCPHNNV